jgi:hypothetical protein
VWLCRLPDLAEIIVEDAEAGDAQPASPNAARGFDLEPVALTNRGSDPMPLAQLAWKKCEDDGLIVSCGSSRCFHPRRTALRAAVSCSASFFLASSSCAGGNCRMPRASRTIETQASFLRTTFWISSRAAALFHPVSDSPASK